MKIALCFIISYDHILNKEALWREWIAENKDIINIYFYYKDLKKITSKWILDHVIPEAYILETSYYHMIPAYTSIMKYTASHDPANQWFCFLTDSCCPIISPIQFRSLFYKNYNKSIMSWKPAWWNPDFHKRANLRLLPQELRLAHDPWFILKRKNVRQITQFMEDSNKKNLVDLICAGGLANESLFAIILYMCGIISRANTPSKQHVISSPTHISDWSRMTSATSPHVFKEGSLTDLRFIDDALKKHPYAMFLRKVAPEFPDEILRQYIYDDKRVKVDCYDLFWDDLRFAMYRIYYKYSKWLRFFASIAFLWILFQEFVGIAETMKQREKH